MENYTEIVSNLNAELYDKFVFEDLGFSFSTSGYSEAILFGSEVIWCSEFSERKHDPETGYEPFEPFIKRTFNAYIDKLNMLKF